MNRYSVYTHDIELLGFRTIEMDEFVSEDTCARLAATSPMRQHQRFYFTVSINAMSRRKHFVDKLRDVHAP